MERVNKDTYYLNIALDVSSRGTCLRRNYGAVIVNNDEIIATGYTGAPRGRFNCSEIGKCTREELNIPSGQRYELCRSVHAEQNAIISASRKDMLGATMYIAGYEVKTGEPTVGTDSCAMCKRVIINAGIKRVVFLDKEQKNGYREIDTEAWIMCDDSLPREYLEEYTNKNNKGMDGYTFECGM